MTLYTPVTPHPSAKTRYLVDNMHALAYKLDSFGCLSTEGHHRAWSVGRTGFCGLSSMFKFYNSLLVQRPVLTKSATTAVLFSVGDAAAHSDILAGASSARLSSEATDDVGVLACEHALLSGARARAGISARCWVGTGGWC